MVAAATLAAATLAAATLAVATMAAVATTFIRVGMSVPSASRTTLACSATSTTKCIVAMTMDIMSSAQPQQRAGGHVDQMARPHQKSEVGTHIGSCVLHT